MKMPLVILVTLGCAVGGQLLLKTGMSRIGRVGRTGRPRWRRGVGALLRGLLLYGLSAVLWLYVLSRTELSYAFPFLSLTYVAILLTARFGLNEPLGANRVAGSLLIVLGVLLVSLS